MEDVSNMTGENLHRRAPRGIKLNEIRFNGKEGNFVFLDLLNRQEGQKADKTNLGESVDVVFLKIRRRIAGFKKGNKSMKEFDTVYVSTEHNTKEDQIYLFGAKEKGKADDLYNKYKDFIHTERVVYAFLLRKDKERELVRVIIKGSALNPNRETKATGTVDFFTYVQDKEKGTHIYEYVTNLSSVKETGPLGDFFTINFRRGKKLPGDKLIAVVEEIKTLHQYSIEQDEYYADAQKIEEPAEKKLPEIEYPEEDINPDDIPF